MAERPPLALDLAALERAGFAIPSERFSALGEALRPLRRQVLETEPAEPGRAAIIVVTSALPGEGKTFLALNLALSLCGESGARVLLVDADPYRQGLAAPLGLRGQPGLSDALGDAGLDLGGLVRKTTLPGLSLLPSGRRAAGPGDPPSGERLTAALTALTSRFGQGGTTIVDTPPVLASAEAIILAGHADRVVVVVENRRTPRRALRHTLSMLQDCPNVDCIVNMADRDVQGLRGYG